MRFSLPTGDAEATPGATLAECRAALGDLVGTGTTVLVVLHELGALAPLVRRAVVLRHGAVVHDGAPPRPSPEHAGPEHEHVHPHDGDTEPEEPGVTPAVRWQA